ncbi:hypothetical protein BDY21DRAFT_367628 [Lineolata rhizophorae]|uniref:Fungal N-terminal domain-containing protein n=1 Tax=Lineolata rhizophorae TaxID=578093 RepID=A0A6A6NM98_9PEZI|nr:hypothetical protein BDY21DRAFT_367628 [Lineolata rhizophorae]
MQSGLGSWINKSTSPQLDATGAVVESRDATRVGPRGCRRDQERVVDRDKIVNHGPGSCDTLGRWHVVEETSQLPRSPPSHLPTKYAHIMDIAASAASLTHLSASCITLLAKWIHEVKEVDNVIQDFRAEIETLHNVLISLAKSTARLRPPSDKSVLWIQVNMTLLDTGKALGKLEDILGCFNTENPAIFNKIGRQFKMNLLSGEISVVRQRIGLLSSTLGLPLHMIAIEAQSQKTARDDSAAAAIQSAISKLENLLGQHLPISSSATTEDREIYAHATEIIKTATELASNASVGSGINSFVEAAPEDRSWISDMENGFSEMREESQSSSAFYDDVPSKAIETSIQGEQLSAGEHSRIPIREDLNVRMYGKRMAKGISYMERREFENAVKAFTSAQDDLQRSRSSSITKSMFNEEYRKQKFSRRNMRLENWLSTRGILKEPGTFVLTVQMVDTHYSDQKVRPITNR